MEINCVFTDGQCLKRKITRLRRILRTLWRSTRAERVGELRDGEDAFAAVFLAFFCAHAGHLVAGNRPEVRDYFETEIKKLGLEKSAGVKIIFAPAKLAYFEKFNVALRRTDILWTKPSELSFYCAFGLPVIIAEPVGSQEDFNREWLINMGAGIDSLPVEYANEWLPDLLSSGRLARSAMDGYLNAEAKAVYRIDKLID